MRSFCWHRQPFSSKVHAIAVSSFVSTYLISFDECNIIPHSEYQMTNQRIGREKKTYEFVFKKVSETKLWRERLNSLVEWLKEWMRRSTHWMNEIEKKTWRKRFPFGRCVFLACIDKYWWAVIFDDIARWIREWLAKAQKFNLNAQWRRDTYKTTFWTLNSVLMVKNHVWSANGKISHTKLKQNGLQTSNTNE